MERRSFQNSHMSISIIYGYAYIERYIFIDIDIDVDIREISPFDTWPFDTNLLMRTPSKHGGKVSARGEVL